jgi:hypothetical protein
MGQFPSPTFATAMEELASTPDAKSRISEMGHERTLATQQAAYF